MTEGRTSRHFDRDPHGLADRSTLLAGVERGFLQSGMGGVGGRVGHGPHRWVQAAPHIRP